MIKRTKRNAALAKKADAVVQALTEKEMLGSIFAIQARTLMAKKLDPGAHWDHLNIDNPELYTPHCSVEVRSPGQVEIFRVGRSSAQALAIAEHIRDLNGDDKLERIPGTVDPDFYNPAHLIDFYTGIGDSHSFTEDRYRMVLRTVDMPLGIHNGFQSRFLTTAAQDAAAQHILARVKDRKKMVALDELFGDPRIGYRDNGGRTCKLYIDANSLIALQAGGNYMRQTMDYISGSTEATLFYGRHGTHSIACGDDLAEAKTIITLALDLKPMIKLDDHGALFADPYAYRGVERVNPFTLHTQEDVSPENDDEDEIGDISNHVRHNFNERAQMINHSYPSVEEARQAVRAAKASIKAWHNNPGQSTRNGPAPFV